jgi:hypothetical protein
LELIGTGDQAGTWGNTTNTNLGTLIEQAISGYDVQTLTSGTTLTLTIPNGASGVARNMYLEFTGNGSTVIVPSNKKLYFVYNNCTSGTITFKVSGQTGVTIPNGSKQILVSNGTDIEEAITIASLVGVTTTSLTALGVNAGDSITSGADNVTIGYNAGTAITTGGENVVVGANAGDSITTGTGHTIVGDAAGSALSTANFSTAVGLEAMLTGNYTNSLAFGFDAQVTGANYGRIGDTSVDVYAKSFNNTSDARDKADIQDTNLGLSFIMQLQPRMYRWDFRESYRSPKPAADATKEEWDAWREANKLSNLTHDGTHKRNRFHQGLIAQEVKTVLDNMGVDFGGFRDAEVNGGDAQMGLEYIQFIAPLIKAIQELKAEFDEYKRTHP